MAGAAQSNGCAVIHFVYSANVLNQDHPPQQHAKGAACCMLLLTRSRGRCNCWPAADCVPSISLCQAYAPFHTMKHYCLSLAPLQAPGPWVGRILAICLPEKLHSMLNEEFWGVDVDEESGLVYGPFKHASKRIAKYVSAAWKVRNALAHPSDVA